MAQWGEVETDEMAKASEQASEIEEWFNGKPAEPALRRVREVILAADPRLMEHLKYGPVQFAYQGDFANFVQHNEKQRARDVQPGREDSRSLRARGGRQSARFMGFGDVAEVNLRAAELTRIESAWCSIAAPRKKAGKS